MHTEALIMMISSCTVVTVMTVYYFVKVLRTPPKDPANDSYTETN